MAVAGEERAADGVAAVHRPYALGRLDVPELERAMTRRGDELVVGRDGEAAHVRAVPGEVEREHLDGLDGGRFGRGGRRQVVHLEGVVRERGEELCARGRVSVQPESVSRPTGTDEVEKEEEDAPAPRPCS